jgi:hypothetical protein
LGVSDMCDPPDYCVPQVTPQFRHHDKSFFNDVSAASQFLVLCALL